MEQQQESDMLSKMREIDGVLTLPAEEFFKQMWCEALTYDDVLLCTNYSEITPREANPGTQLTPNIYLSNPLLSADMDTVTESRMAIHMALNGGLWFIHSNFKSPEDQLKEVEIVKNYTHGIIKNPAFVKSNDTIGDVLERIQREDLIFSTFPVVSEDWQVTWVVWKEVLKEMFAWNRVGSLAKKIQNFARLEETQIKWDPVEYAYNYFLKNPGITKIVILDKNGELKGLISHSDITRINKERQLSIFPTRDSDHNLRVWATARLILDDEWKLDKHAIVTRVGDLVDAGLDIIAVSTAHGQTKNVLDTVASIRWAFRDLDIVAWNVVNAEWVYELKKAGANVVKVWIWPWSICTTRIETGVGVPQLSAVNRCVQGAEALWWVSIIADWGIEKAWDIVKALAVWARAVMLGSMLAWTKEAPGDIIEFQGELYKQYRGMGSEWAMRDWSATRYSQSVRDNTRKIVPEWIEALKKYAWSVDDILQKARGSIQAWLWYNGAKDPKELVEKARFSRISNAWSRESGTHGVVPISGISKL